MGVDVVNTARTLGAIADQPSFFQHGKMLGYGGSAHRHFGGNLADGFGTMA
jgi:hypothetical protein